MKKLILFGLQAKDSLVLSNIGYAYDAKAMCQYMLKELNAIEKDIPEERKVFVLESIRNNYIVQVGTLDLESHDLENDYQILVDLKDFKFEKETADVKDTN